MRFNFTKHLRALWSRPKGHSSPKAIRRSFHPALESLEGRDVPSTTPVITTNLPNLVDAPNQQLPQTVTVQDSHAASSLTWQTSMGTAAFLLDQQLGFVNTTNYHANWSGSLNEKWIQDAHAHWYYILPSGNLYLWNTAPTHANPTGQLLGTLDSIDYYNPRWLTAASDATDAAHYQGGQDQAFEVEAALKLQDPNTTGGVRENLYGANERWIKGTDPVTGKAAAFFILPSGLLYEWNGTASASGRLMARLDPMYYQVDLLRQLTQSRSGAPAVAVSFTSASSDTYSNTLTIAPTNYRGTLWSQVIVSSSDGTTFSRIFQVSFRDHAPALSVPGTVAVTGGATTTFNLHGSDQDPGDSAYLTYNIDFARNAFGSLLQLPSGNQLPPLTYAPGMNNYGGMGTRWFKASLGRWYFLDQTGAFFQWSQVGKAQGIYLGTLPPFYLSNPGQLQVQTNAVLPAGASVSVDATGQVTVTMPTGFKGHNYSLLAWLSDGMETTIQRFVITVK